MKNFGKILTSILMIAALLVTMCVPAMATEATTPPTITTPSASDTATVTINGVKEGAVVTFYRIIDPEYTANGFTGYKAKTIDGTTIANITAPTQTEIEAIWTALKAGKTDGLTSTASVTVGADGIAQANVGAGMWMAIVTGSGNTIYNPMIVSVNYATQDGNTIIEGGQISASDQLHLEDKNLYAKSSTPTVDKTVNRTQSNNSVSVGDKLTYTINAVLPSYPSNATNKTFYVKDTMGTGLTLLADSIKVNGIAADSSNEFKDDDGYVIARLLVEGNSFKVVFIYDTLTAAPKVTYDAVVNDDAVVGSAGNDNDVTLVYANDPTKGTNWDSPGTSDDPEEEPNPEDPASGVTTDTDTVTVYTYQLAFKKTGTGDDADALAGAQFGIYSDEACTKLIDVVTTNSYGYAVSSKVAEGTYYVKEIAAPAGYSLNTQVYTITASKTSATSTATTVKRTYTTEKPSDDAQSVGWLTDAGVFYTTNPGGTAKEAYLESETTTTGTVTTGTGTDDNGIALLDTDIPNTKVSELPSTGGMGTTLFIVGGVALMVLAIVLISANKRRSANK